mmetsp:Transcript_32541/g.56274  ORF Transcript_32541/g.56274 Transcript_32541/m.56274 type:complete len:410 (+) Transcript_32541:1602-2831(+)
MPEADIKKGLNFMKDKRVTSYTLQQKIDFLKSKISPEDLEEVLKRHAAEEKAKDSNPSPTAQPTQQAQPLTSVMVPAAPANDNSWKSYAAIGAVGAAILGVAGTTLYMNTQRESRRPKKKPPPSRDSYSDYHERDNVPSRDLPHPTLHALVKQQEKTEETVQRLAKQVESLVNVLKPKEPDSSPEVPRIPVLKVTSPPAEIIEEVKVPEISLPELVQSFLSAAPNDEMRNSSIKSMKLWFTQVLSGIADPKRSRINLTTPDYVRSVSKINGHEVLFRALGFTIQSGYWVFDPKSKQKLEKGLELINAEHAKIAPTKFAYSPAQPWKPKTSTEEAQPVLNHSASLPDFSIKQSSFSVSQPNVPQMAPTTPQTEAEQKVSDVTSSPEQNPEAEATDETQSEENSEVPIVSS